MEKEFVNVKQAAEFLGVGVATLNKWRILGYGPPFHKFGKCVRYSKGDLLRWAQGHRITPPKTRWE